jgi:hypothetical protein
VRLSQLVIINPKLRIDFSVVEHSVLSRYMEKDISRVYMAKSIGRSLA